MNYRAIYNELIGRAVDRQLTGYYETHHILPRCLGGSYRPSNLIKLTPEEHYVAHQLLVKMYPGHKGLLWAALAMAGNGSNSKRQNNKVYGWLRRQFVSNQIGNKLSEETKDKISASQIARFSKNGPQKATMGFLGKKHSDDTKMRMSLSQIGMNKNKHRLPRSEEHKNKIREAVTIWHSNQRAIKASTNMVSI